MAIGKPDWNYGRGRFADPIGDFSKSLGSFADRLLRQQEQKKLDARYEENKAYQRERQAKADARLAKADAEKAALKASQDAYLKGLLSGPKDLRSGLLTDTIAADPAQQAMINNVTMSPEEIAIYNKGNLDPKSPDAVAIANSPEYQTMQPKAPVSIMDTLTKPIDVNAPFDPTASAMKMAQATGPVLNAAPLEQPQQSQFDPSVIQNTPLYQSAAEKMKQQEVLGKQLAQASSDLATAPADMYSETRTQQLERVGQEMVAKGITPPPQFLKDLETSREADKQVRLTTYKNNETQLAKLSDSANKLKLDVAKLDDKNGNTSFTPKDITASSNALDTYLDKAFKNMDIPYEKQREAKDAAGVIYQNLVNDGMHPSTAQLIAQKSIAIEPGMLWFDDKASIDPTKVAKLKGQFAALGGAGSKGSNERTQLVDMYAQNIAQQNAIRKDQAGFGRTPQQNLYNKTGEVINKNVTAPTTPLKASLQSLFNPETSTSDNSLEQAVKDWKYDPTVPKEPTTGTSGNTEPAFNTVMRDGKEVRVLNPNATFQPYPEEPGLYDASLDMIPGTLAAKQLFKTTGKAGTEITKEVAKTVKKKLSERAMKKAREESTKKLRAKAAKPESITEAVTKNNPLKALREKRASLMTEKLKIQKQLKHPGTKGKKALRKRLEEITTEMKAY